MESAQDETFQDEVFEPYAIAIGHTVLAWNDLHRWLGCLLESVLFPRQSNPMRVLWNSATQDRAARQMLRAAVSYRYPANSSVKHDPIMWLIGQVDALEDIRNDIIHTALMRNRQGGVVVSSTETKRAAKLASKSDLLGEIHWCCDTTIALRNYALAIDRGLESVHGTLPRIPSLPNRGQKRTPPDQRRQSRS